MATEVASRRSSGDPAPLLETEARRKAPGFQPADRPPSAGRPELSGSKATPLSAKRNDRGLELARLRRGRDPVYDSAHRLPDSAQATDWAGRHHRRYDDHLPDAWQLEGSTRFVSHSLP